MAKQPKTTGAAGGVAIDTRNVSKSYGRGSGTVLALRDVSVAFGERTFTAVMGPSGSGKRTLIQCAAGLDKPSSGSVWLGETELSKLKEPKLTVTRREQIGFIFQAFNLIPSLNTQQNIVLPLPIGARRIRS